MALALSHRPARNVQARRSPRPRLNVVPTRRRTTRLFVLAATIVAGGLAGIAVIHTQIASRQAHIDRITRLIAEENDSFDTLRAVRAELRAPTRLDEAARSLGMQPATSSSFLAVDPLVLAMTTASTGGNDDAGDVPDYLDPLDQFRMVKILGSSGR